MVNRMRNCPHCGIPTSTNSERCASCGRRVYFSVKTPDYEEINPKDNIARDTLWWAVIGTIAAAITLLGGYVLVLTPLETTRPESQILGSASLAFVLAGCLFGVFLAPTLGVIGGRLGKSIAGTRSSGVIGSIFGGLLYGVLATGFAVINFVLGT